MEAAPRPTISPARCGNMPKTVGDARNGAVTHPGGAKETHCYADI